MRSALILDVLRAARGAKDALPVRDFLLDAVHGPALGGSRGKCPDNK